MIFIGKQWHRDLLIQMSLDISQTRPKIISQETVTNLDEYRRFRHVVRNVYGNEPAIKKYTENAKTKSHLLII